MLIERLLSLVAKAKDNQSNLSGTSMVGEFKALGDALQAMGDTAPQLVLVTSPNDMVYMGVATPDLFQQADVGSTRFLFGPVAREHVRLVAPFTIPEKGTVACYSLEPLNIVERELEPLAQQVADAAS